MKTKRKKLTNFLKLGILFFGISLLLFNCEQRELTEEIETVSIDNKYQSLTMEDATGFLNNFKSKGYSKKSTKGINLDIDINSLNLEEVENSDLSMPVFEATTKHIDIESKVFLIKVNDSLQGFLINRIPEKEDSSSNFSGMISITDLEGRFINGYRIENGVFISQFVKKKASIEPSTSYSLSRRKDADDPDDCEKGSFRNDCLQTLDEILIRADGGSNNSNTGLSFGSDSNSWGFQSFSFPNTGSGGSVRGPSSSSNSANVFPCDDPIHGCDKMPWAKLVKNLNITNQRQIEFLELKPSVVSTINNFLSQNNNSYQAEKLVKATIEILSEPILSINSQEIQYENKIRSYIQKLKQFGNPEDELFADYLGSLIPFDSSFTKGDKFKIYQIAQKQVHGLFKKYLFAVVVPFAEAAYPFVVYAVTEATLGAALPLLSRIPIAMVIRGARLNKMVSQVGVLGVRGFNSNTRIITTASPIRKAEELFATVTKNAISKTPQSNGAIVANMGNNNFITYRPLSASTSGYKASINLDFSNIWANPRVLKFN
jgi:hypothetical protein